MGCACMVCAWLVRTPAHGNELLTGAKTVEFDYASGLVPSAAEVEGTNSPFIFHFRFLQHKLRGTTVVPPFSENREIPHNAVPRSCVEKTLLMLHLCWTFRKIVVPRSCTRKTHKCYTFRRCVIPSVGLSSSSSSSSGSSSSSTSSTTTGKCGQS